MSLTLFIAVLTASFVIVRIGAIAFQLTGLEWSLAKFQALSCFSGTGFTTREAELITGNPQRRKIATILIIMGNAGIVTLIATFANALSTEKSLWKTISENLLPFNIPDLLVPWINLITILVPAYLIYRLFTNRHFLRKLTNFIRKKIIHTKLIDSVTIEELVVITGGYGVARIEVDSKSSVKDKTLAESHLRDKDITVLAISRGEETISNPSADMKIQLGDELISFGNLENLRSFK
jgi:hypothetical protein